MPIGISLVIGTQMKIPDRGKIPKSTRQGEKIPKVPDRGGKRAVGNLWSLNPYGQDELSSIHGQS